MATSANALYVLRLVLGGPVRRAFFTPAPAPISRAWGVRSNSSWSPQPQTQTAQSPSAASFLEADEGDYTEAAEFLPDREAKEASPVPWPTVFSHPGDPKPRKPEPCDLVVRLASSHKLEAARKVAMDLKALGTWIHHRKMYLGPAMESLSPTEQGRRNFMFWLNLYPVRGVTPNTAKLRAEWEPVVYRLIAEHIDDPAFLGDFLLLAGRKGLLNVVFHILITPLVSMLPPQESEALVDKAVAAYITACRPKGTSFRSSRLRRTADRQIDRWWNEYIRALVIVGYNEHARALLHSPPVGVRFFPFTRSITLGYDVTKPANANAARAESHIDRNDPLTAMIKSPRPGQEVLAALLERVLDRTQLNLPHVAELADAQQQLLSSERPELLELLEQQFLGSHVDGRSNVGVRVQWWAHAEIMRHARNGEHAEAIKAFRRRFLWVGLPATSVGVDELATAMPWRMPNQRIITTMIPSILALLSPTDRQVYLVAYYSQRGFAPNLRPNEYTHLAFVGSAGLAGGPLAALAVMEVIAEKGYDPGTPAWSALLLHLMAKGRSTSAMEVLAGMERRAPFGGSGFRMPAPAGRTYSGLIRMCTNRGHMDQAVEILRRFEQYVKSTGERAELLAEFDGTKSFLGRLQHSETGPQQTAKESRTQAKLKYELERIDSEDVNSRMRRLFERKRRHLLDGDEGQESETKEAAVSEEREIGANEKADAEERDASGWERAAAEETKSAFA